MAAIVLLTLVWVSIVESQNLRRKQKPRPKGPKFNVAGAINDGQMIKALEINYPLNFFDGSMGSADWRSPAVYSPSLVTSSEAQRTWGEWSQAQDQEDVWLYENYFYGMERGVIMESGALNGLLFSNSFMFEKFANWTCIHVGAYVFPRPFPPAAHPKVPSRRGTSTHRLPPVYRHFLRAIRKANGHRQR